MSRNKKMLFLSAALIPAALSLGGAAVVSAGHPNGVALKFTVLYDNYVHKEGTKADWGFSCLIEGAERTILFDTGTKPEILIPNAEALGVDLKKVDLVVLSHAHEDHTGGLPAVLAANPRVTVFYPVSFAPEFGRRTKEAGAEVRTVDKPVEVCRNVYVTGEMGDRIKEQSLVIDSPNGLIIFTGCSHQGIVSVLERAKEIRDRPIHLVLGGFHLGDTPDTGVESIIAAFRDLKVERCGATHCTGDRPIALFKAAFGDRYVPVGTGRVIEVPGF
jgi:7,8-dihydropterin-6-yl-methyl-4-(beta-D-ribofuranosyl)aminobenzene 5'-phosphate synthase